jgi:hypothetical protein
VTLDDVAVEAPVGLHRPLEVDERARHEPLVEARAAQRLLGQLDVEAPRVGAHGGQAAAVHRDRPAEREPFEEPAHVDAHGHHVAASRRGVDAAGAFDDAGEHGASSPRY